MQRITVVLITSKILFNTNIGTVATGLNCFSSWNQYLLYNAFAIHISFWITVLHTQLKRFVVYFAFTIQLMNASFHLFYFLTHPWNFLLSLNKGLRDYSKLLLDFSWLHTPATFFFFLLWEYKIVNSKFWHFQEG